MVEPQPNGAVTTNGEKEKEHDHPHPQLDVKRLHAPPTEQQDLLLLTFSTDLNRYATSLDKEEITAQQTDIKKELFQIINLASPTPTRVIRNNIGRTFTQIFERGNRKVLFETINDLCAILNAVKSDTKSRHAAVHCLGGVYLAAGDSAINLSNLAAQSVLKLAKSAQNHTGYRAAIFRALGRIIKGIAPSADELVARDIWKQARSAANGDKSLLVQVQACYCLEQLIRHTSFFDNSNDYEKLQSVLWKVIEASSSAVRHAAASCFSAVLVKAFSENPKDAVPKIKKPKKTTKKQGQDDVDDEVPERPDSPAPSKPATQLSFSLVDLLKQISGPYCRLTTSSRGRAALGVCYIKTLKALGQKVVADHYADIARHFFTDILSYPSIAVNRYRILIARKYVRIILEEVVGKQLLGEAGQLHAAKFLVNDILRDYPQTLKERSEPSKQTLTGALSALTSLMQSLGSAMQSTAEASRETLLTVLQHPSYTVQVHTAACLKAFVLACPQQLLPSVTICMNTLHRELNLLAGPRQAPRKCVGLANGLSAMLSTSSTQPLYGSVDVYSRVLSHATNILKSAGHSDLRISSTQIQVAWILIGGLMTLGPNFAKIHLSQLLLLWRNALPKPLGRDNIGRRDMLELSFLAHVRECALGSIMTFLTFNRRLLTFDVTKRLSSMLQNTTEFLNSLPNKKTTEELGRRLSPALQLQDFDLMVRRRVSQCYTTLVSIAPPGSSQELLNTNLLPFAMASFADPEGHAPSTLSASIASAAGNFESIWEMSDNSGFGVTGNINGFDIRPLPGEQDTSTQQHWVTRKGTEVSLDRTVMSPICDALEHDSIYLYIGNLTGSLDMPDPPSTEVVNAAINLFAISLPLQTPKIQESMLEQMSSFLTSSVLARDPARKAALNANIALALLSALKVAAKETLSASGNLQAANVEKVLQALLHVLVIDPDQSVRYIAAEALGRLCKSSGSAFTTTEVKYIVDQIVANRDPNARAGYSLALGCIHSQLGGMAAGFHLKNIHSILLSLSSDPHPTVHFWAIDSLSRLAETAGLSFFGYVNTTLGILAQLYVVESHSEETGSLATSNIEIDLPTPAAIGRGIDSLINVLGPDLQDMAKARDMIMSLVSLFKTEEDDLVVVESLRCQEHLSLYAPGQIDFQQYVRDLQQGLDSDSTPIREMSIDGLHNLMKRDTEEVLRAAEPGLEDQLWQLLDLKSGQEVIRSIIRNWMHQSGLANTAQWIQRCHAVLTKTVQKEEQAPPTAKAKSTTAGPDLLDEEVAGFAASAKEAQEETSEVVGATKELLRWQVRTFAMDCLGELITMIMDHASRHEESEAAMALQNRVGDAVRIAFSASTAGVVELRLRGLRIIDQVLKLFGRTPDPDFPEASLLDQYQAQIGSALTPAFAADSSPELAAEAVNVCATFIAAGIVTNADRMGRILKLLVTALEDFSRNTETSAIGDLKGLSSNAQTMVKMAVFSAWAELQIASREQTYLNNVMQPYIARLTPLWLESLREFARLRFEPDISNATGTAPLSSDLDMVYSSLNRETLLKFYQDVWLNLMDAIASLIEEDSDFVFDALDGKTEPATPGGTLAKANDINYRDEPTAFFFVLFGLIFEALVSRNNDIANRDYTFKILQALKKILNPAVAGTAIYREAVFSEMMDVLARMSLTEGLGVQTVVIEITRNLCLGHPFAREDHGDSTNDETLSDEIDQMFELTRVMVLVLTGLIPNLAESQSKARHQLSDEAVNLVTLSLSALVDAASVFPSIIKTDLHACILHCFTTIMGTGICQTAVVPQALPIFRRFVTTLARDSSSQETSQQLRGALVRFLSIMKNAQKRESEAALPAEKNCLLASTILVSSAGQALQKHDPLLSRYVRELSDCLEARLTSKVAAGCCRSLLLLPKKGAVESSLTAQLLPRLIRFLVIPSDVDGMDETRTMIAHALTQWTTTIERSQTPSAAALTISTLLTRATKEGEGTYKETASRLLDLAGTDQMSFRAVVGGLPSEQRSLLEQILRSAGPARPVAEEQHSDDVEEPSIALKMSFGP